MMIPPISTNSTEAATSAQASAAKTASPAVAASKSAPAKAPEEDKVTISRAAQATQTVAPAQTKRVPTAVQVRLLSRQGQSATQIALKLGLSLQSVESYLGTPQQPAAKAE